MSPAVYRTLTVLCELVIALPVGTNLGLWHVWLALVSGQLLLTRGALIPALSALGLTPAQVRRAWQAFAQGDWQIATLLAHWQQLIRREGRWHAHVHGGYRPLVIDLSAFFRPRLQDCATKHFDSRAGKALPAIPLALMASVGAVAGQRLAILRALLRASDDDPSETALQQQALNEAVRLAAADEVLVVDRGFRITQLQAANAPRYVARGAKNLTARRAQPPAYSGHGRRPTRGLLVRPLPRQRKGKHIAASQPDRVEQWSEDGQTLRAEYWFDLVLTNAPANAPTFDIVVIHDPRYAEPLLLVTTLRLSAVSLRNLYLDRWPIEQLPLAAKQLIGAERQWVWAREARQRLPELALWAGNILSYLAASQPAVPTGYWDRNPRRTAGRLRRVLTHADFFHDFTLPLRIRQKRSVTDQLPKGTSARLRRYDQQRAST
jgi:hypothetical protein